MGRPRRWTDDDLIAAVESSTTLMEVLERLGLAKGGASLKAVRRRILELGLDTPALLRLARSAKWVADPADEMAQAGVRPTWTEDDLRWAVLGATSMREVMERLGYRAGGEAWMTVKAHILKLGLDTSHFGRRARSRAASANAVKQTRDNRSWTDTDLTLAVAGSKSILGVLRHLGLKPGGSMYPMIRDHIARLGLSTDHFTGQAWNKGLQVVTNPGRPLEELLVKDSKQRNTHSLKERLFREGVKERTCAECGLTEWRGRPIPLQLDHINGDRSDNRL